MAAIPALVIAAGMLPTATLSATPETGAPITAPSSGTVGRTWTGTAPGPATGSLVACVDNVNADLYRQTVNLPSPDFYTSGERTGLLEVRIDWDPASGDINTQDLALIVVLPDGSQVDSDGGAPKEAVSIVDPIAGEYRVFVCSFATVLPQPYSGAVRLTTSPLSSAANPPSTPTSLRFGPITTVDPQRDVAEPSLRIDGDGNEYACGPFGASRATEFAQKSEDGGDTFRVLGTPPEGRIAPGGGGDCELSVGRTRNSSGFYTLSYTGLAALVNFSTSRSENAGRTFVGSAVSESPVVVDRQWMDTVGANTVYLTYRQIPLGSFVQKSVDGGLTYGPGVRAIPEISISGNLIVDNRTGRTGTVYIAHTFGNEVRIARSTNADALTPAYTAYTVIGDCGDDPETANCVKGDPSSIFPSLAQDSAGNLYMAWTEAGSYNTYYSYHAAPTGSDDLSTGWSPKIQVNRDDVKSTNMPWIDAGDPGRIAVSFYGSVVDGNPEIGTFRGPWDVYVNTSVNALAAPGSVQMSQTKATTHPIHWDSICLSGLACSTSGGDRTLLDFFQVRHDTAGRIRVTYNESNKRYGDAVGPIAIVTYSKQVAGPGLFAGPNPPADTRPRIGFVRADPAGDARYPFSLFGSPTAPPSPPFRTNYAALDFRSVRSGPGTVGSQPGVTFTMKLADLSPAAISAAQAGLNSPNLLYVVRFFSGFEAHAAVASVSPTGAFRFGFTDLALSADTKLEIYPLQTTIPGTVDSATGTITMTVPFSLIEHVRVSADPSDPPLVRDAKANDLIHEVTGFTFGNASGDPAVQYFLSQADSTPPFDYRLGTRQSTPPPPPLPPVSIGDVTVTEGDSGTVDARFTLRLSEPASRSITVRYRTVNDTARAPGDYVSESGSVTFAPGQTQKRIAITVKGDTKDEFTERFFVNLSDARIADNQGVGTILDDDGPPSLRINDVT
ncbi:MAG: hypothetical protein H0V12_04185, partial [Chloroflexi bacterium]|nr:hypothetical protein [Chloroflexota bacterium]